MSQASSIIRSSLGNVAVCGVAIGVLLSSQSAAAQGIPLPTPKAAVIGVGVLTGLSALAVWNHKSRCATGGSFDMNGTFQPSFYSPGSIDFLPISCPSEADSNDKSEWQQLASEVHGDYVIFKDTYWLRKNLKKAGRDGKTRGCAAHHIVPEKDDPGTEETPSSSDESRKLLERCSIDINDADNGVFLPDKLNDNDTDCKGAYHKTLHTPEYYKEVVIALRASYVLGRCDAVRKTLRGLGEKLERMDKFQYGAPKAPGTSAPKLTASRVPKVRATEPPAAQVVNSEGDAGAVDYPRPPGGFQ